MNGVLNKYVGTWTGSFNGRQLVLVISKYKRDYSSYVQDFHPEPLFWDQLIAKYKLTDSSGAILANTLNYPDDSSAITYKDDFNNINTYSLVYLGENSKCGNNGYAYLFYQNSTTIHFVYSHGGGVYPGCTSYANPTFPTTETVVLTKI